MTDFFDCPCPMAKSAADLVALSEILLGRTFDCRAPVAWDRFAVGFLDSNTWKLPPEMCRQYDGTFEQMVAEYESAVTEVRGKGCLTKYPVDVPDVSALTVDGEDAIMPIACEFLNMIRMMDAV
jgi:hypothetical protein